MQITADYVQLMARYNVWQNGNLIDAATGLSAEARDLDRGAFFGSIRRTFNHMLWVDQMWMSRFGVGSTPAGRIKDSPELFDDWTGFCAARKLMDDVILDWSREQTMAGLSGDLSWYSASMDKDFTMALAVCVVQLFNHQTHHRGQVHAMLTAAGARPGDTDVPFMPDLIA